MNIETRIEIKVENFDLILNDSDVIYILNSVRPKIKMSKQELDQTKKIALWLAIKNFDPSKSKFNSYLTNWLRYELLHWTTNEVRFKKKSFIKTVKSPKLSSFDESVYEFFDGLIDIEKRVLEEKLYNYKTDSQIRKDLNLSKWEFKEIKKSLQKKYA